MTLVNKQTDYAVQLLIALANGAQTERLSLRQFAVERNISFLFLQKIARKLRAAKLIAADKGARGGYFLARTAENISLKDVVHALEQKKEEQTKKSMYCRINDFQSSTKVLSKVEQEMHALMERHTIAQMKHYVTAS